jgi:choline dehydrogenase-like flavoprotein
MEAKRMLDDARRLPAGCSISCDICIVGAGAAGITSAHELKDSGMDIVLLEAGGTSLKDRDQDIYRGEVVDPSRHGRLDLYRDRRFGGTTVVWGGRCAPFDEIDLRPRPHVPYSGWPITRKDLDPYYLRAHEYCDLGAYAYDVRRALPGQQAQMIPGLESPDVRADQLWRFSLPTDFAKAFGQALKRAGNVRVYLHANALAIRTTENGASVDHLEVGTLENKRFTVRAKQFVLAAGGLEVTRLLLVSNDVNPKGVGNDRDLVGRFYMSHMTGDLGEVRFMPRGGPTVWDYERTCDGVYCRRCLSISGERQRLNGLLNFRATLTYPFIAAPQHGNGTLSALYLVKKFLARRVPPEYSKALSQMTPLQEVSAHLRNVVKDFGNLTAFGCMWIRKRILSKRKLPSVAFQSRSNVYTLHFDGEQSPNPESRVFLSDHRDAFGIKRLRVDWRTRDLDALSVVGSCQLVGKALEQSGVGKMLFRAELMADRVREFSTVGSHHIGTTRMSVAPSEGVVDANCRVHGVDNLYIASSSVFPTSSCANPTLTIVALAIRLADHLRRLSDRGIEMQSSVELAASRVVPV